MLDVFPAMDTQTIISIIIGVVVSAITFWLGYRRTVGAFEERVRNANSELTASVVKRVAVQREVMSSKHYILLKRAKAYSLSVSLEKLLLFPDVKAVVFAEIIDNNFLDQASKNAIIELLDQSGLEGEEEIPSELATVPTLGAVKSQRYEQLALMSAFVGIFVSWLAASGQEDLLVRFSQIAVGARVEILLLGMVAIFVALRLYFVLAKREPGAKDSSKEDPQFRGHNT